MKKYLDGLVDNAESLDRFAGIADLVREKDKNQKEYSLQSTREALIYLAKEAIALEDEHKSLGLTRGEMAFYHALSNPENVQDF